MGEVIDLRRPERHRGKTLCLNGHHKWKTWKEKQFEIGRAHV